MTFPIKNIVLDELVKKSKFINFNYLKVHKFEVKLYSWSKLKGYNSVGSNLLRIIKVGGKRYQVNLLTVIKTKYYHFVHRKPNVYLKDNWNAIFIKSCLISS